MFLQAIRQGDFELEWQPALPDDAVVINGCQGCIGRYGLGYGPEKHRKDIAQKYGIMKPGFVLPKEIEFYFKIKNRHGFDFLCRFAKDHGYAKPILQSLLTRGRVLKPLELQEANAKNKEIKKHVADLVQELSRLTTADIDDDFKIVTLIDTNPFYEWQMEETYPIHYTIIERDADRIRKIWYDSNIMRDC